MAEALRQLGAAREGSDCPILCAGDLFDKWNSPPELITFAVQHLPKNFWSIPGQHDLPNHAYSERHRSAYGTLVAAGVVNELDPDFGGQGVNKFPGGLHVYPFPWGREIIPPPSVGDPGTCHLAIIHHFVWAGKSTGYPGAPPTSKVKGFTKKLAGYDYAHFGDNHKHFIADLNGTTIYNGGGFMVRKRDEHRAAMVPKVAQLWRHYADGEYSHHLVPIDLQDEDEWLGADPADATSTNQLDMAEFIQGMEALGESNVDFNQALRRHLNEAPPSPRALQMILESLDDV